VSNECLQPKQTWRTTAAAHLGMAPITDTAQAKRLEAAAWTAYHGRATPTEFARWVENMWGDQYGNRAYCLFVSLTA